CLPASASALGRRLGASGARARYAAELASARRLPPILRADLSAASARGGCPARATRPARAGPAPAGGPMGALAALLQSDAASAPCRRPERDHAGVSGGRFELLARGRR